MDHTAPIATRQPFALSAAEYALPAHLRASVVGSTGSTNSDLLALARSGGLPSAESAQVAVLIAHGQSAGRGRQGRTWQAPSGASLLMSVACVRQEPLQQLGAITLMLGMAAAQALRDCGVPVQLKWPNDVWLHGAKLAGILVESVATRAGTAVVAGIGVNGAMTAPDRIACGQAVAALEDAIALDAALAAQIGRGIACAFAAVLCARDLAAPANLPTQFAQFDALRDRDVVLFANDQPLGAGCALGVDSQGHLLVRDSAGMRSYVSGEVSLRAA